MPVVSVRPRDRRAFLETVTLGGAALLASAFRGGAPSDASRRELHLALLSDTHVPGDRRSGYRGMNPWENLHTVAAQVAAARPDGVLVCGDAARQEGRVEDYQELRALLAPVAAVSPVHVALGNHDDRESFLKVFPDPPGVRAPVEGRHVTVIEHEALRVVVLDSLLYVDRVAGLLGRAQRAWLEGFLPKIADRPAVLFVHHPPSDGDGDLLDGDRLLALARANPHVKALFHGHAHVWSVGRRDGLPVVSLPAVGYSFDDAQPVGWVDARFRADGVSLTLRAIAGNRADDGKETLVAWDQPLTEPRSRG
jgi:3',5'-cyclic-AMP phosphodiesterase